MSEFLSSEDADEGYSGDGSGGRHSPEDYSTLEEYMYDTDRDGDSEVSKSLRVFKWQETLMAMIEIEENTNKTEIGLRAYPMGLSVLRSNHKGDIDEIASILNEFMKVYTDDISNMENANEVDDRILSKEIDQPYDEGSKLSNPKRFKLPDSHLSEVQRDYVDHSFMRGWIHRHIMALGLGKSKHTRKIHDSKVSSYAAAFSEAVNELRDSIECEIVRYVQNSEMVWREEGLDYGIYKGLEEMTQLMETENKEYMEFKMGDLERFVDAGRDSEGGVDEDE